MLVVMGSDTSKIAADPVREKHHKYIRRDSGFLRCHIASLRHGIRKPAICEIITVLTIEKVVMKGATRKGCPTMSRVTEQKCI